MSGFFGKIKNFFDFREMNKLVKGEFFKFVKSSTFYVLTAAVIILAVVTGLIYNPDSDGWGGFQDMLGGTVSTEDYFTYLNGAEYLEYVDRYELDIPYIDYIEANKAFTRETKYQYLTSSPQSYHMALNPVSKIKDTSAEYNSFFETPVDYLYGDNDATAGLGSMQKFILADFAFFDVFLKQGETYAEKKDFISGLFKNNDVQNIELELQNYGAQLFESEAKLSLVVTDSAVLNMLKDSVVKTKLVRIMKDVFSHPEGESAYEAFIYYRLYFLPLHDHIYYNSQNTYNNVMNNLNRAKLFFYYAQDSGYTVSIADFVKRTILGYGEAFDDLEDALYTTEMERKKEGNDYKYTEESVKNLYETYKKFIALYGMSRNMIAAGLNVGVNFLFFVTGADSGSLVSSIISPAPQVYKDFNDRHNVINEEINTTNASLNENLSFKNVYEAISGFFDTLVLDNLIFTKEGIDLQTRMTETLAVVDESLKITMDDKIYGESFSFIEDRVDVLLTESTLLTKDNIVGKYYGEYYRGELLQALSQGYALPYAAVDEYFKLAQRLVIEGGYINDYLKLKNLSLIVDKENFTDADLSNIYGIFNFLIVGTSKYSLKSDISEIVFMLDNRESIGSLTSPLGMDRGYAFMI
ncbi:MAG: hypothetical protein LBQ27_00080, partial [Clostridiales bacterium]|nr:hypothetical protein [Clostridiales bacterium]